MISASAYKDSAYLVYYIFSVKGYLSVIYLFLEAGSHLFKASLKHFTSASRLEI